MKLGVHASADAANVAATDCLAGWLAASTTRNVMVAAGNTPIELYRRIGERGLKLAPHHLERFARSDILSGIETYQRTANPMASVRLVLPSERRFGAIIITKL